MGKIKRLSFAKRVLQGKDVKVYIRRVFDGSLRATYLKHVPFHHGLKKKGRL
jgi:hypothetical protein